jgi:membrane protein YdbS with pleckstrin-like domain
VPRDTRGNEAGSHPHPDANAALPLWTCERDYDQVRSQPFARVEEAKNLMSYVTSVLQPDEQIRYITRIHWIIFIPSIIVFAIAAATFALGAVTRPSGAFNLWASIAAVLAFGGVVMMSAAWFKRDTTEIAVTNRRIIYKRGFISRRTIEMQMDKVESVDVDQTVWGRLLGFGNIVIRGVGEGIEPLKNIDSPIEFRNHVTGER